MRRPGLIIVVACALFAAACGSTAAADGGNLSTTELDTAPLRHAISSQVAGSLSRGSMPASCVDATAIRVAAVLVDDLGAAGLETFGVTAEDAYAVTTDAFFVWLPATTQGRVVAAVADCAFATEELSERIPGVSSASFACLIDALSAEGLLSAEASRVAASRFDTAEAECLGAGERTAFNTWLTTRIVEFLPAMLPPMDCGAIETVPMSAALGFDIEYFEHSLLDVNIEQPVGCTFGNPDEPGPWVLIYVATQDYQRDLYQHSQPLAQMVDDWSMYPDLLDVADVYFIARGSSVARYADAVTAVNQDGSTTAALTAGDYVLMVSAFSGDAKHPLTRAELAGAAEALAATLALH